MNTILFKMGSPYDESVSVSTEQDGVKKAVSRYGKKEGTGSQAWQGSDKPDSAGLTKPVTHHRIHLIKNFDNT
jgi:hypothetical protein